MAGLTDFTSRGQGIGAEHDRQLRDNKVRDVLSVIADQARVSNRARAEVIASVMADISGASRPHSDTPPIDDAQADHPQIDDAVRSAHQLAGSAGTFGMPTASRLARRLERFLSDSGFRDELRLIEAREDLIELQRVLAFGE